MSSVAHVFTYKLLRLPRHTRLSRLCYVIVVFAISGLFHALSDLTQGIPSNESGALRFFVIQAFAIMFEDSVTALFTRSKKLTGGYKPYALTIFVARVLGYCWVVAWLTWSTPIWIFPSLQRDKGNPLVPLPASVSDSLRSLAKDFTS